MSLWLPYIKLRPSIAGEFKTFTLSDQSIEITWGQPRVIKSNILESSSGAYSIPATSDEVLKLFVIAQYDERNENQNRNNMVFDNIDLIECWLMINNQRVPNINYTMDFATKDYNRLYAALLEAGLNDINSETGCLIDYLNFGKLYPIICFNLSHHESYTDLNNLMIEFNWRLRNAPTKKYVFYFILTEKKTCELNMAQKKITMLKTLRM